MAKPAHSNLDAAVTGWLCFVNRALTPRSFPRAWLCRAVREISPLNRLLKPLYIGGPGYEEFVAALTEIAYTACEHGAQLGLGRQTIYPRPQARHISALLRTMRGLINSGRSDGIKSLG